MVMSLPFNAILGVCRRSSSPFLLSLLEIIFIILSALFITLCDFTTTSLSCIGSLFRVTTFVESVCALHGNAQITSPSKRLFFMIIVILLLTDRIVLIL